MKLKWRKSKVNGTCIGGEAQQLGLREITVQKYTEKARQPKVFAKSFGGMAGNVYFCTIVNCKS